MLIKTRKLPPTQTEGPRMRATSGGATLTVPYPQGSLDPGRTVALMLARALGHDGDVVHTEGGRYRTAAQYKTP